MEKAIEWVPYTKKSEEIDYQYWVDRFIQLSEEKGNPISGREMSKNHLPSMMWYVRNCPDETVKTTNDFKEWCGFFVLKTITKEKATRLIYKMQEQLDRPLMYDDFRGKGCYHPSLPLEETEKGA